MLMVQLCREKGNKSNESVTLLRNKFLYNTLIVILIMYSFQYVQI